MLLPKRVEIHMKKHMTEREFKQKLLDKYIKLQNAYHGFLLDEENAILVFKNNQNEKKEKYTIFHERFENRRLVPVNHWGANYFYIGHEAFLVFKEQGLIAVPNNQGYCNALYNYKKGEFIVKQGIWDRISSGKHNKYLNEHDTFLASFTITSDWEQDDVIYYTNPLTKEKETESFVVSASKFYAFLNLDGTIRGNCLFTGKSFSKPEDQIPLDEYESLEEFKKIRKNWCNEMKQRNKNAYQEMIEKRNDGSISPYLDNEVMRVINLKK